MVILVVFGEQLGCGPIDEVAEFLGVMGYERVNKRRLYHLQKTKAPP